jgi:hypothetical protein
VDIESQADSFASALLMPLDDFRRQVPGIATFESLDVAADRYGVSMTAATLRWLDYTEEHAVLVVHRDGFVLWARSSKPAFRAGAFFRSKRQVVPIPAAVLASDPQVARELKGLEVEAHLWFPYVERGTTLREMKISSDNYDYVMTLLLLPRGTSAWKPRQDDDQE